MGTEDFTYTSNPSVLRVGVPKNYTEKEILSLCESVKKQAGTSYLVVVVPDDVDLEIIV